MYEIALVLKNENGNLIEKISTTFEPSDIELLRRFVGFIDRVRETTLLQRGMPNMTLSMLARLAGLFIVVVSISAWAEQPIRAENKFFINGKNIEISPSLQRELRSSWIDSDSGPFKSALPLKDAQWVSDLISISELVRKPSCKRLKMLQTARREDKEDIYKGQILRSGAFDEQWTINACSEIHIYRVFNEVGSQELSVYEMR